MLSQEVLPEPKRKRATKPGVAGGVPGRVAGGASRYRGGASQDQDCGSDWCDRAADLGNGVHASLQVS